MNQHIDPPVAITSARPSRSQDIATRQMRYLFSMALRTLCFVLAIVTTGPLRWGFVVGAVFLPYVAVVLANATDHRRGPSPAAFHVEERPQLNGSSATTTGVERPGSGPSGPGMSH